MPQFRIIYRHYTDNFMSSLPLNKIISHSKIQQIGAICRRCYNIRDACLYFHHILIIQFIINRSILRTTFRQGFLCRANVTLSMAAYKKPDIEGISSSFTPEMWYNNGISMATVVKSHDIDYCGTLHWRHNDHDSVSNHQPHGCLLNRLFRPRSKKTSKLRVTGLCAGNSPGPVNSRTKGQ